MQKTILLRAIIALATALLIAPEIYAQCSGCSPSIRHGFDPGSPIKFYLSPALSQTEYDAAANAINGWNAWFEMYCLEPPYSITSSQIGAVCIGEDPYLGVGNPGLFNGNDQIGLNPQYRNATDLMNTVLLHEIGHAIGFEDVGQNCANLSVMDGNINSDTGPFMTGIGTADECALYTYVSPPPPPPPPPSGDDPAQTQNGSDPLVLDLNGDGIHTTGTSDPVWFDLDGDGHKERITWTDGATAEGFLWIDLHHDGRIDDGSELFGIGTLMPDGTRAKNGFEALAVYDLPENGGNGDGVLDENDGVWNQLRIWVDANHDGISQGGEVASLHAYGIVRIPLRPVKTRIVDPAGNTHRLQALYVRKVEGTEKAFLVESLTFQRADR
jgi:hypothetical protein